MHDPRPRWAVRSFEGPVCNYQFTDALESGSQARALLYESTDYWTSGYAFGRAIAVTEHALGGATNSLTLEAARTQKVLQIVKLQHSRVKNARKGKVLLDYLLIQ